MKIYKYKTISDKYSLKCNHHKKEFAIVEKLIEYISISGTDPNYEIIYDVYPIVEFSINLI